MAEKKLPLHWKILIGMLAGAVVGLLINLLGIDAATVEQWPGPVAWIATQLAELVGFTGDLFLRGLRFVAVPIVLFSLIVGASSVSDIRKLSRIGSRTVLIYMATTTVAITIGVVLANLTRPGTRMPKDTQDELIAQGAEAASAKLQVAEARDIWDTLLSIVPSNPFKALAEGDMLQVVFIAMTIGIVLTLLPAEKSQPVIALVDALNDVVIKIVDLIMKTAPIAVFALLAKVMAQLGLDLIAALVTYSLTVLTGLLVMVLLVYPALLKTFTKVPVRRFFQAIAPAQLLAFSSSSSTATLPVSMECVEKRVGVSDEVTSFVLPLGATLNMDGTALYQGVAAIFIGQLYGFDLSLADQVTIVITATLASIGTAGVPGVGIVMLVIVLQSIDIPTDAIQGGIAMILGVDRILDMCRTVTNISGDCTVATVISSLEGETLEPHPDFLEG